MLSVSPSYVEDWTPRIGRDAVERYLLFKRMQRLGGVIGVISWPVIFVGIGLGMAPVIIAGAILLVVNAWVLFVRARAQRAAAVEAARRYVGLPPGALSPPIAGSPDLFDIWLSSHGYGGEAWRPRFAPGTS